MLNLMRSILIRLKKLKTYKRICGVLLFCLFGLGLFGGLSLEVFASTDYTDTISIGNLQHQWSILNRNQGEPVITLNTTSVKHGYFPYQATLQVENYPTNVSSEYVFNGYLIDTFTLKVETAIASNLYDIFFEEPIIESNVDTYVTYSAKTNSVNQWNNNVTTIQIYVIQYLNNFHINNSIESNVTINIRQSWWNQSAIPALPAVTWSHNSFTSSDTFGQFSDSFVLQNIANMLQELGFDNNVTILQSINSNIQNDSSGVADFLNDEVDNAYQVEYAADQAISSALPSADNELDDILSYDYTSIGTDSLTALSFWKSLGDYILSNSNLVGIGALLVGCLFLGFVIYLLRL